MTNFRSWDPPDLASCIRSTAARRRRARRDLRAEGRAHDAARTGSPTSTAAIAEAQRTQPADPVAAAARPARRGAVVREQPVLPQAALPRAARSTACCASASCSTGSRCARCPKVTIDFGNGKTLERTLTGNSAHLVLDVDGRPVDALPGLFSRRRVPRSCSSRAHAIGDRRSRQAGAAASPMRASGPPIAAPRAPPPRSLEASMLAPTKHMVEVPVLRAVTHGRRRRHAQNLELHDRVHEAFAAARSAGRRRVRRRGSTASCS